MTEKGSIYTELGDELSITKEDEYFRYEYDLLNRLERVYSLDDITEEEVFVKSYVSNASGMRILAEDAEGIKTHYTFDTGGKVVEKETDGTIRNFFYLGCIAEQQAKRATRLGSKVVAHKENNGTTSETLYYGTVHLGSSVLMTDATGATVWTGAVTPFADSETTEGLSEHVMFTGKELDTDTGLYYYNARWYDPQLGRFITEDPIRDGVNWFVYVNNNPLNYIDPTGLETVIFYFINKKDFLSKVVGGSHVAVMVTNPKGDGPVIYDPSGSFPARNRASDQIILDDNNDGVNTPTVEEYIEYHTKGGATATTYTVDTTSEEVSEILKAMVETGDGGVASCAISTTDALKSSGVDDFEGLTNNIYPGGLKADMDKLAENDPSVIVETYEAITPKEETE